MLHISQVRPILEASLSLGQNFLHYIFLVFIWLIIFFLEAFVSFTELGIPLWECMCVVWCLGQGINNNDKSV